MKLLPCLVAATALMASACDAQPVVNTDKGQVSGVVDGTVESFKGIPFAAPPVGDLRWRAPQPAAKWSGVRAGDHFGADCMQLPFAHDDAPLTTTPSEDCLYANVWRPTKPTGKKLPVMVWIYGGGFVNGGSSPKIYDGSAFARDGIIYVSFNYRLGRFGFFGFPALTKADADHGLLGNYGYMDQVAALKWVKANIAAFGGDPAQVTIVGESAGGASVHFLLTSPLAKGLFARAIVQSGGGRGSLMGPRRLSEDRPGTPSSETLGVKFAARKGIAGTDDTALAALRALPADAVTDGLNLGAFSDDAGGPMLDGHVVVEDPGASYAAGRQAEVPVMIGANSGDIGFFYAPTKDAAFASFGAHAAEAKAAYDPDGTAPLERVNAQIAMDRTMVEPARFVARTLAHHGLTAYEYRFSYTATPRRADSPNGAPHASEIPFEMDTVSARYGTAATEQDQSVAKLMHAYWFNFARTGNPNGAGLPTWAAYSSASDNILDLSAGGQAVPGADPYKTRLDVTAAAVQ